jgi:hypothetical protein
MSSISFGFAFDASNMRETHLKKLKSLLTKTIFSTTTATAVLTTLSLPTISKADDVLTPDIKNAVEFVAQVQKQRKLLSDEFEIEFPNESLGLSIHENSYKGFPVLTVDEFKTSSYPQLRQGAIITKVG